MFEKCATLEELIRAKREYHDQITRAYYVERTMSKIEFEAKHSQQQNDFEARRAIFAPPFKSDDEYREEYRTANATRKGEIREILHGLRLREYQDQAEE